MVHTFQPFPLEYLEMDVFKKIGQEWMLISAGDEQKANTMTASWGGFGVLWGKNVATVYIRESRYTKEFLYRQDSFSLTFLDEKYKREMKFLGAVSGRDEDKMEEARLNFGYSMGIPYVDEGNLVFLCSKLSATPITKEHFIDPNIQSQWYADGDYHTMYIGEILQVMAR